MWNYDSELIRKIAKAINDTQNSKAQTVLADLADDLGIADQVFDKMEELEFNND